MGFGRSEELFAKSLNDWLTEVVACVFTIIRAKHRCSFDVSQLSPRYGMMLQQVDEEIKEPRWGQGLG